MLNATAAAALLLRSTCMRALSWRPQVIGMEPSDVIDELTTGS
jgi:hypothetical protein